MSDSKESMQIAKHVIFVGRVQGVGFRFTVLSAANRCGLAGVVRNIPDGNVEMIAQGNPGDIDECIRQIQQTFASYINETKIEEIPYDPEYEGFKITF